MLLSRTCSNVKLEFHYIAIFENKNQVHATRCSVLYNFFFLLSKEYLVINVGYSAKSLNSFFFRQEVFVITVAELTKTVGIFHVLTTRQNLEKIYAKIFERNNLLFRPHLWGKELYTQMVFLFIWFTFVWFTAIFVRINFFLYKNVNSKLHFTPQNISILCS